MMSVFKHLLPRARATSIIVDKPLRQLFEGLSPSFETLIEYFEDIWLDIFPQTTRHIYQWERTFGIPIGQGIALTEQQRRDRLDGYWQAIGGQSPRYIEDTLQAAGFDVYVHEFWELPATDPPTIRNPYVALGQVLYGCGDPQVQCGEPLALCGNSPDKDGYFLVNKLYVAGKDYTVGCGDTLAQCGEPTALCGENDGLRFFRIEYPTPSDPNVWPHIYYIGAQTFPDEAIISPDRIEEFEDLVLKISPAHLWVCLLVSVQDNVIEKSTGNTVIEKSTGNTVIARS
jgi:hypothetical protein